MSASKACLRELTLERNGPSTSQFGDIEAGLRCDLRGSGQKARAPAELHSEKQTTMSTALPEANILMGISLHKNPAVQLISGWRLV